MLRRARQHIHQRVANLLENQFAEVVETQPELVAHQYTEAKLTEQAIVYWQQAGRQARRRSANSEAISHLIKGLELLSTRSDTPERARLELDMQMTLGPALLATRGYAAPEVERAYCRAQALCEQMGDTSPRFNVLAGLYLYYLVAGPLQTAHELALQLLGLARKRADDTAMLQAARLAIGEVAMYRGDFLTACQELELGLEFSAPHQIPPSPWPGSHPDVQCHFYDAIVLWLLGLPDQAHTRMQQALRRARELAHPLTLALTLSWAARLYIWVGVWGRVRTLVGELVALCTVQSFAHFGAHGIMLQGWLRVMSDDDASGLTQLRQGLETHRRTGTQCMRPYFLSLLAEASGKAGQAEAGYAALDQALSIISQTGEHLWEAELHRIRGELLLTQTHPPTVNAQSEAAMACFQKALLIARQQQAKSLQLRAVMSLSRLWRQQGRREDTRVILAPIYHEFTESYLTADLTEAKALLDDLS